MPTFPDLIGLLDLIEATAPRNSRMLRLLRDLFSQNPSKRTFATSVLLSSMSKDIREQSVDDLLCTAIDMKNPISEFASDLELVNLNYNYTNFDLENITSILMSSASDYTIKRQSLEQLTMLLFDCELKRGKNLFVAHGPEDAFTFVLKDIL